MELSLLKHLLPAAHTLKDNLILRNQKTAHAWPTILTRKETSTTFVFAPINRLLSNHLNRECIISILLAV